MTRADRAAIREAQRVGILDALGVDPGLTLSEIARSTGLHRQLVGRLLVALVDRGDLAGRYHSRAWTGAATPIEAAARLHIPLRRLAEVRSIQRRYYLIAARPSRAPMAGHLSPVPGPRVARAARRRDSRRRRRSDRYDRRGPRPRRPRPPTHGGSADRPRLVAAIDYAGAHASLVGRYPAL